MKSNHYIFRNKGREIRLTLLTIYICLNGQYDTYHTLPLQMFCRVGKQAVQLVMELSNSVRLRKKGLRSCLDIPRLVGWLYLNNAKLLWVIIKLFCVLNKLGLCFDHIMSPNQKVTKQLNYHFHEQEFQLTKNITSFFMSIDRNFTMLY